MFAMFNNLEEWLAPWSDSEIPDSADDGCMDNTTCSSDSVINSNVITVSIGHRKALSAWLTEPIRFTLEHKLVCLEFLDFRSKLTIV